LGVRGAKWKLSRVLSDRLVVLSREMSAYVDRNLPRPFFLPEHMFAPVTMIHSLVDMERMAPPSTEERARLRRELGIGDNTPAVGIMAAFVPKKQQLELLRYLRNHPTALPGSSSLYFVGDFRPGGDEYSRACLAESQCSGLEERLRFIGYSPHVADWYRALDVVLVCSREEGLARCMIESLACGTPVVSFDVCSAREVLEAGPCGLVVRQGDFDGLLAALNAIVTDPSTRARFGAAGARLARQLFAPEVVVQAYHQVYQELSRRSHPLAA
jgi:glycosyltransferase involved in cell wall biosynthesis